MLSIKQYMFSHKLLIVAHRGSSGTAPENTRAAYLKALELKVPAIEIDVHLTKDFEVVAFHDDFLTRTSQSDLSINQTDLNDLKNYEIGSWFSEEFAKERILTLDNVLQLIVNKAYLIVEIKPSNYFPELLIQKILETIEKYKYAQKTVFVSFDFELVKIIKNINKKYLTAAIKIPEFDLLPAKIQSISNCDAVICSFSELTDKFMENAKQSNIPIGVYDVDSKNEFYEAINKGVIGIGTNYPEIMLKLIE
jgi:glycerophosphoryl diester phosphodiesterase